MTHDYKLIAPDKTMCSQGHVLDAATEVRVKRHTRYGRYVARMCRTCLQTYQEGFLD